MAFKENLTSEEIQDIVDVLPEFQAATKKISNKMRLQVQSKLALQLKDVKMYKTPEAIEELKKLIVNQHYNSLVCAGEPVGIRAAEAMSQPTTQAALNVFHTAGSLASASVATGIDAIKELYDVKQERSFENCRIHFKNKNLTFEEVIDMRKKFVGITVESLLPSKTFMYYNENDAPSWYQTYLEFSGKKIPYAPIVNGKKTKLGFLRLKFDLSKLYAYGITLTKVANRIQQERGIICIPSPTHLGIIDIFVDVYMIEQELNRKIGSRSKAEYKIGFDTNNASALFINVVLIPELKDMVVSGIPGIKQIFPPSEGSNVTMYLLNDEKVDNGIYKVHLNNIKILLEGFPKSKIIDAMKMCDMEILREFDKYLEVKVFNSDKSPRKIIQDRWSAEKKTMEESFQKLKDSGLAVRREVTPFIRTAGYFYAQSNGTNLARLLAHPDVDPISTISTNPNEILRNLGIEAARNFLITSYVSIVVASEDFVNTRHVCIIADYQTSKGTLLPITSRGSAQQNPGTLAKASFEEPMPAFVDAAVFGKSEEVKNVSTSIFVGKRMIMGTGAFKARYDKKALDEAEVLWNEYKQAQVVTFEDTLTDKVVLEEADLQDEDLRIDFNEGEGETKIGLISNSADIMVDEYPKTTMKQAFEIPSVIISKLSLPEFIYNIIRKATLLEEPTESQSSKMIPPPPLKNFSSISKKGLPALPKMTPTQIVETAVPVPTKEVTMEELDGLNFEM